MEERRLPLFPGLPAVGEEGDDDDNDDDVDVDKDDDVDDDDKKDWC